MVRDLNGNVNQSLFETLLNKIPILLIFSPGFKNLLFFIVSILIPSSLISKILSTFNEVFGIIGYNKIEIFLISSKDEYIIVFNL